MRPVDRLVFTYSALTAGKTKLLLIILATSVGVGSIIILTALGNGARNYITGEFSSLGNRLLIVLPGRNETTGGPPPMAGSTPRDLTLDDALALLRSPAIERLAPVTIGEAEVSYANRSRDVMVMGSTSDLKIVREVPLGKGRFLPDQDPHLASAICVIGEEVRQELFGNQVAIGQWIRIDQRRFRVIGIIEEKGESFDLDWNGLVIVPIASAQALFNTESVFRILINGRSREDLPKVKKDVLSLLKARHEGEEDVTVITQGAMLATFDKILGTLTLAVGGIAAISMAVAGVLIMNVMLVSVSQRTSEVGLIKALGGSSAQVSNLFLMEALLLSAAGALFGALFGEFGTYLMRYFFPVLPAYPPVWARVSAIALALAVGPLFGLLPARRAARLDPVLALNKR